MSHNELYACSAGHVAQTGRYPRRECAVAGNALKITVFGAICRRPARRLRSEVQAAYAIGGVDAVIDMMRRARVIYPFDAPLWVTGRIDDARIDGWVGLALALANDFLDNPFAPDTVTKAQRELRRCVKNMVRR